MGQKTDALEREIVQRREAIERKMRALEERARDDVKDAGDTISSKVEERTHVRQYADERPLTTVVGAFGTGVVLGIASNRGRSGKHERRPYDGDSRRGLLDELMGTASGAIGGTVQGEVRDLVRKLFDPQADDDTLGPSAHPSVDTRSVPRPQTNGRASDTDTRI